MSFSKITFFAILVFPSIVIGQVKINSKDSIEIKKQIEGFYSWYIEVVKNKSDDEGFSPTFVKRGDGMTTLNFTRYKDNLRKYKFTEEFIQRKINDYSECVDSLTKIPFDKFSELGDLQYFEMIGCDFGNRYEWTGGQESKDKAELISLKLEDKRTIIGYIGFSSYGRSDGRAIVTFRKFKKEWRVDNIRV